jgi:hemerythrin
MMKRGQYEEYQAHKNDHEELLDQIRGLMDDYFADAEAGALRLEQSLSDWFAGHFATFDARLHGQLKE